MITFFLARQISRAETIWNCSKVGNTELLSENLMEATAADLMKVVTEKVNTPTNYYFLIIL